MKRLTIEYIQNYNDITNQLEKPKYIVWLNDYDNLESVCLASFNDKLDALSLIDALEFAQAKGMLKVG